MRYTIKILYNKRVKESFSSDYIDEIVDWFKNNYQTLIEMDKDFNFYVFDGSRKIDLEEKVEMGFYDNIR